MEKETLQEFRMRIKNLEDKVDELEKITQPQILKEMINKVINDNYLESIELGKKRYAHLLKDPNQYYCMESDIR